MNFKLSHPSFPQYTFKLLQVDAEIEDQVNRIGPVNVVTGAYDWPQRKTFSFHGWTDKLNSLWWPRDADEFASCVLLIDDLRNDTLTSLIEAQKAATPLGTWRYPYLIMSANMVPKKGLMQGTAGPGSIWTYPAESFSQGGVTPVLVETPRVEWKLYPLPPVNLSSLLPSEIFRGLWLLPLVDIRYFLRNVPLNQYPSYSSSTSTEPGYPLIEINHDVPAAWMPPLLTYPKDLGAPANFVPIANNGTHDAINGGMRFGEAADLQAAMEGWRVVNRDVRSNCNIPGGGGIAHDQFTGVISDYPEDWSLIGVESYHTDACDFILEKKARLAGGLCDNRTLDDLIARKLQFALRVSGTDAFYSVTTRILDGITIPTTVADIGVDVDGPDSIEAQLLPLVNLGVHASTRYPQVAEYDQLVTAAKQWSLLYYAWRTNQAFLIFPDIYPLIPNGHAAVIRWDFGGDERTWRTTYVALEGVRGTESGGCCTVREPFYAVIDGEGSLQDHLHGFYAFTELLDQGGVLTTHPNPRRGFVLHVNGSTQTINPARDESGKVAVPVGLTVWLKPGVPYLDTTTGKIFDHYLFTTSDLLQVVRLKPQLELNQFGHFGAIIQRWNPDIKGFVDSEDIWVVVLD